MVAPARAWRFKSSLAHKNKTTSSTRCFVFVSSSFRIQGMNSIVAFIACGGGLFISLYMLYKKFTHKNLACPREHPCDSVLHSRFARSFGVPNEFLGAFYFALVAVLLAFPVGETGTAWFLLILFFVLMTGALFSLYLIGVQAFVIRRWCLWCVGIALTNLVLIVSLLSFPIHQIVPLLKTQKLFWVVLHNVGFILGVGAATITDIFFFRFLKDRVISQEEKETMDTLTSIIWVGLGVLLISGVALYLGDIGRLSISSKFLLKVVVVGVIVVNGILLNMLVAPYLRRLSFEGTVPASRFRRAAFALGGISIVSWYVAFLLGSLRTIHIDFLSALFGYGILLAVVIFGSQIAERIITRKFNQ